MALARTRLIIAPCHLGVRVVGLDGHGALACSANRKQHVCARNGGGSPGAGGAQGIKRGRNTERLHITEDDSTSSRPMSSSPPQSTPAALKAQYSPAQFQRRASGRLGGLCAGSDPGADLDRLRLLSSHAYAGGGTKDGPMRAGIHFFSVQCGDRVANSLHEDARSRRPEERSVCARRCVQEWQKRAVQKRALADHYPRTRRTALILSGLVLN